MMNPILENILFIVENDRNDGKSIIYDGTIIYWNPINHVVEKERLLAYDTDKSIVHIGVTNYSSTIADDTCKIL